MSEITTVGLDLAKTVFHMVGFDERGREVRKRMLRRSQVLDFFARLRPCKIGMEACAGAHYWARELEQLGHTVHLVPAQHVRPYVQGNKHDYNDARAIVEAMRRPGMHFVAVKTPAQQAVQALHRLRQGCLRDRTALANRVRGLLAEQGVVAPRGLAALRRRLAELLEATAEPLDPLLRLLLAQAWQQLQELDAHLAAYDRVLRAQARESAACRRLQQLPGYGPVLASAFATAVGDGRGFRRGRDVSASLGVVPRQHGTGGQPRLLGISKRGDRYLRSLLVHGARAVVRQAAGKDDRLSRWVNRLRAERGYNKAVVALANKLARWGWAVLRYEQVALPG